MEQWFGKVAIVTGASSGIGATIAEALVKKGMVVVGLARRKDKIIELSKKLVNCPGRLHAIKCDLSEEGTIKAAFWWVKSNLGAVNVLINNAGIIRRTTLSEGETEEWKQIFDVNVLGLCICSREALRLMKRNAVEMRGHIINISSISGLRVPNLIPNLLNAYPASKHAVKAISETLRKELIHDNVQIKVTNISPGTVNTEIMGTNNIKLSEEDILELMQHRTSLQSEDIANAVLYILSTPPCVQVTELTIQPLGEKL